MDIEAIKKDLAPLYDALERAERGELPYADVKPFTAKRGVYPQRNGLLMERVRITGGEATLANLRLLSDLAAETQPGYLHLTSRNAVQFHDMRAAGCIAVARTCTDNGLPFRGGCADTFRNIAVSLGAGVATDGSRDLFPFARYLTDLIFDWEPAFNLPRKIKIGLASPSDPGLALRQDLGFLATRNDAGEFGFSVYGAGGFGHAPSLGIKLLDFIPPEELAIAARAMVELFYDLGDRTNRARARLRHLRTSLGDDVFRAKYLAYFSRHGAGEYPPPPAFAADWSYHAAPAAAEPAEPADQADYARWIALAVEPNRFEGEASVTLFVPFGVLTPPAFAALVDMLESFNVPAVRLTDRQNVFIPSVPRASLPALYNALRAFPVDLTLRSIVGKVTSCIGAAVCKAGILDCPKYARMVAEALDAHFKSNPGSFTPERARAVMDRLRLSGCPNSCNDHEQAAIGLQGMRKRVDGELVDGFTVWRKDGAAHIGAEDPEFIPAADLPARIVPLLTEAGIL
ncbi:MAG: nitrite/sulfite reductase [Kiritimatiellae bacterium]|nr:nitrite/sulfite reductase [Kiritimatiellia bacterium]